MYFIYFYYVCYIYLPNIDDNTLTQMSSIWNGLFVLGVAPSLFSVICFMLNYDALLGMRLSYLGQPSKTWCNNLRWFCTYVKPLQNLFGLTTANEDRVQLFALKPLNSFQCSLFYNFLKHHFAWEAAGNTDNDTKKIFIIFMTKKK